MIQTFKRKNFRLGWTKIELARMLQMIDDFKLHTKDVFGLYQASNMETSKLHVLNHLSDALRQVGGTSYLDAGLYEGFHKRFKTKCKLFSIRRKTTMDRILIKCPKWSPNTPFIETEILWTALTNLLKNASEIVWLSLCQLKHPSKWSVLKKHRNDFWTWNGTESVLDLSHNLLKGFVSTSQKMAVLVSSNFVRRVFM